MEISTQLTPTTASCLKCQLLGRRRLTCDKARSCQDLPLAMFLGPVLLAGWAATVALFWLALR